jgi:hypothetical protein
MPTAIAAPPRNDDIGYPCMGGHNVRCRFQPSRTSATEYTFTRQFLVPENGSQQGLAYADGRYYLTFDLGGERSARIVAYDADGHELRRSGPLPMGHAVELSYRQADGNLYVSNGGHGLFHVYVVDMRRNPPAIVRTYDFSELGLNGMVAIDNVRDRMVLFGGPHVGPFTFAFAGMDGRLERRFTTRIPGVPQGLEVLGDQIALYTSAWDRSSNTLTLLSDTGRITKTLPVPVAREGEGLAVNPQTNALHMGFKWPNEVRRMSPTVSPPLGNNLLANPNAESGTGATTFAPAWPIPSWATAGGLTALQYGSARVPSTGGSGTTLFVGGTAAAATAAQTVDLAWAGARIDTGRLRYELSGLLGGYQNQGDNAQVTVTFRDGHGASVGNRRIGPVSASDRGNATALLHRASRGVVPRGTRRADVVLTARRVTGGHNDGMADNLSFTVQGTDVQR